MWSMVTPGQPQLSSYLHLVPTILSPGQKPESKHSNHKARRGHGNEALEGRRVKSKVYELIYNYLNLLKCTQKPSNRSVGFKPLYNTKISFEPDLCRTSPLKKSLNTQNFEFCLRIRSSTSPRRLCIIFSSDILPCIKIVTKIFIILRKYVYKSKGIRVFTFLNCSSKWNIIFFCYQLINSSCSIKAEGCLSVYSTSY